MELNSIEAIKCSSIRIGRCFCLTFGDQQELQMGVLHCAYRGVVVKRTLWLIFNVATARAAEAFGREILQVCHNRMEQGDVGVATGTNRCFKGCSS